MASSKGSCITLAAIAGAAATLTGGIIAASSSHAESAVATATIPASGAIEVAQTQIASVAQAAQAGTVQTVDRAPKFQNFSSFEDLNLALREATNVRLTPELLAAAEAGPSNSTQLIGGPVPCDSCDPASIGGFLMENDTLASGSNQPACDDPSLVTDFWAGANDHCVLPGEWPNFEDPTLKDTQIPNFDGSVLGAPNAQQVVNFCGRTGRIDNSVTTAVDDRDDDADVWEFQVVNAPLDFLMRGYADTEGIRVAMTYCFQCAVDSGNRTEFLNCTDGYGISTQWDAFEFRTEPGCVEGQWQENLIPGYYYILVFPLSSVPNDCGIWYNITLTDIDPIGPCCLPLADMDGDCMDGMGKGACIAAGGIFGGVEETCATVPCCNPLAMVPTPDRDFEEGEQPGVFPTAERHCDLAGSTEVNEGCIQDSEGDVVPGVSRITTLVEPNNPGLAIDFNAETTAPNVLQIVTYSGTPDDWSASFRNSAFTKGFQEDDYFVYEITGQDPRFVETLFNAPYGHLPFQLRDLGSDPFTLDCDVVGFITPGFQPACEQTEITFCYNPGVHGIGLGSGETDGISCRTPGLITVNTLDCAPNACCLKDGTCVDGVAQPVCEFDLDGISQGDWSSCCAVTCLAPCDSQSAPVGAPVTDDNCETVDPTIGDLVNSGCEAPDGNQASYWSSLTPPTEQTWCGFNGSFILELPGEPRDLNSDNDYYEGTGLSGLGTNTEMNLTITSQIATRVFVVIGLNRNECPAAPVDNIRDLNETIGVTNAAGATTTFTFCMPADDFMIVVDNTAIVDCGMSYTINLQYTTGGCAAACCDTAAGCVLIAVPPSTQGQGTPRGECQNQGGVYHGLGTRCTDDNGAMPAIPICCDIDCPQGATLDTDTAPACTNNEFGSDSNSGCIANGGGAFQLLGTLDPASGGGGPNAGDSITVCGEAVTYPKAFPPGSFDRDVDFYAFDVPGGVGARDAEALFSWDANFDATVIIIGDNDLNPGSECDVLNDIERIELFSGTAFHDKCDQNANGVSLFAIGGQEQDGSSLCLTAGERHYVYVSPVGQPICSATPDAQYSWSITLFECRGAGAAGGNGSGACCLDATLCVDSIGFLACEAVAPTGTFIDGVDCPTGALQGTLCVGACCVDDTIAAALLCSDGIRFEECCELNGDSFAVGSFAGYSVGDAPIDCASPGICVPATTGVCCYGCDPAPVPGNCPDASGAVGAACTDSNQADCEAAGGVYRDALTCADATDPCQCPGDLNGDGTVDVFDFGDLASNFGSGAPNCATRAQGDINCDGVIDVFDFGDFASNFGCDSN